MGKPNAAKTQNTEKEGVERFYVSECAAPVAPGWRMPLARVAYRRYENHTYCKCVTEVTFGVAAVAGKGTMVTPVVGRQNEFVAGNDLQELLEAARATDVEYIDVWQMSALRDAWQTTDKARRSIAGTVRRYNVAEGCWEGERAMERSIGVLMRDVEKYGLKPVGVVDDEAAKSVSKGCEVARAARVRQAERAKNAKKPVTWQDGTGAPASPSLLDLDGRIFAGALAGTL